MKPEPSKILLRELPEQELRRLDKMLAKEGVATKKQPEKSSFLKRRAMLLSKIFRKSKSKT